MGNATAVIEDAQGKDQEIPVAEVQPAWLSYDEAGRYSGLGRTTLWMKIGAGEIRAARIGKAVRIERASLEEFMQRSAD